MYQINKYSLLALLTSLLPFSFILGILITEILVFVISIIFILVAISKIEGLLVYPSLVIIVREVLVSGLREFFAQNKPGINVSKLSKIKTLLQMSSLGFLIIGNDFKYVENIFLIGEIGLWLSSFLTIYTGYIYFKNSRNLFKE